MEDQKPAAAARTADAEKDDDGNELWYQEDERWELTWPIWHMLPRGDRKALAVKHGYKTIGEFEEFMILQRAVGDSSDLMGSSTVQEPYENKSLYPEPKKALAVAKIKGDQDEDDDDDEDDKSDTDENLQQEMEYEQRAVAEDLSPEQLMEIGGNILMLPDDMLHRVFEWLPVDAYGVLALVSPHWQSFTRTETVYKRLCERLYLNQSKRRQLHVSRFGNSYRNMLEKRPRVRAGGGVYVMKFSQVKKIQRDMWTEIPFGAVLESTYYRYLYFQEDGRVLYALTPSPPHEMFRRFLKMCLTREPDKTAVWGTYHVQKDLVTVRAQQPWQHVQLEMTIQPYNMHGRFGYLSFDRHTTSPTGRFDEDSPGRINFDVPSEPFRFVRHRRL